MTTVGSCTAIHCRSSPKAILAPSFTASCLAPDRTTAVADRWRQGKFRQSVRAAGRDGSNREPLHRATGRGGLADLTGRDAGAWGLLLRAEVAEDRDGHEKHKNTQRMKCSPPLSLPPPAAGKEGEAFSWRTPSWPGNLIAPADKRPVDLVEISYFSDRM